MNRNHPYFNKKNMLVESTTPNQENFDNLPFGPGTNPHFEPAPISMYRPEMVNVKNPMWLDTELDIPAIGDIFREHSYKREQGYHIDGIGSLYTPFEHSHDARSGIISAMVIGVDTTGKSKMLHAPAHIMNTEDAGLRYVLCAESGKTYDLGPVTHTCFFGNVDRPEGMYIPLCNTKAMADGAVFLEDMIKCSTMNDQDIPPYQEEYEGLPPYTPALPSDEAAFDVLNSSYKKKNNHKCICNGNCDCNKE